MYRLTKEALGRELMKKLAITLMLLLVVCNLSGCATTLLVNALSKDETNANAKPVVNKQLLDTIHSLRALQPPKTQTYAFVYQNNQADLTAIDKMRITHLFRVPAREITVNVAPAKASSLWLQLSLTQKRVAALQAIADREKCALRIVFQPSQMDDTLQIVSESLAFNESQGGKA